MDLGRGAAPECELGCGQGRLGPSVQAGPSQLTMGCGLLPPWGAGDSNITRPIDSDQVGGLPGAGAEARRGGLLLGGRAPSFVCLEGARLLPGICHLGWTAAPRADSSGGFSKTSGSSPRDLGALGRLLHFWAPGFPHHRPPYKEGQPAPAPQTRPGARPCMCLGPPGSGTQRLGF